MALDLDVVPLGGSIIVMGWYVCWLGQPAAPTRPAGLQPPLRITRGTAALLQTAQGGHIVLRINTQADARSNSQAGASDGAGRAGDDCV